MSLKIVMLGELKEPDKFYLVEPSKGFSLDFIRLNIGTLYTIVDMKTERIKVSYKLSEIEHGRLGANERETTQHEYLPLSSLVVSAGKE